MMTPKFRAAFEVPEMDSEERLRAFEAELELLRPYYSNHANLRLRVDELRRRIHVLSGLPLGDC